MQMKLNGTDNVESITGYARGTNSRRNDSAFRFSYAQDELEKCLSQNVSPQRMHTRGGASIDHFVDSVVVSNQS